MRNLILLTFLLLDRVCSSNNFALWISGILGWFLGCALRMLVRLKIILQKEWSFTFANSSKSHISWICFRILPKLFESRWPLKRWALLARGPFTISMEKSLRLFFLCWPLRQAILWLDTNFRWPSSWRNLRVPFSARFSWALQSLLCLKRGRRNSYLDILVLFKHHALIKVLQRLSTKRWLNYWV